MVKLRDHVVEILDELKNIQSADHYFSKGKEIPGAISTGDRRSILVNSKIERKIEAVARELKRNDLPTSRQFADNEWRSLVRKAFGPALVGIDLDNNSITNADLILVKVRTAIEDARKKYGRCDYAVGCTLFGNTDVDPIVMGPVRIETREDWLQRQLLTNAVSNITARRIHRLWKGERSSGKRKNHIDRLFEKKIVEAVGNCPFVCSISCNGLGPKTGEAKALSAGRMALAVVALMWTQPSSALDGFRLKVDGDVRHLTVLNFRPDSVNLGSRLSHLPTGHTFGPGEWNALTPQFAAIFKTSAEIFEFFLHPTGQVTRPALMNTLLQALLWFHEGCRETVDAMAIVKFTSAMDSLSCGRKAKGIRELLTARVGFKDSDLLRKSGGPTMKEAVEGLYSDGRSRTVHGTSEDLVYDLTERRRLAEALTRLCLLRSMEWAADNITEDDPNKLSKVLKT